MLLLHIDPHDRWENRVGDGRDRLGRGRREGGLHFSCPSGDYLASTAARRKGEDQNAQELLHPEYSVDNVSHPGPFHAANRSASYNRGRIIGPEFFSATGDAFMGFAAGSVSFARF